MKAVIHRILAVAAFSFVIGCAHFLRKDTRIDPALLPPTAEQLAKNSDNARWFKSFQTADQAQKESRKEIACPAFRDLARETMFPLRDLALLRAHQICPFTDDLPPVSAISEDSARWFAEDVLKARDAEWDRLTPAEQVTHLWDKAAIEKNDRKRETALMDAAGLAEKSGDPKLAEEARQRLWKNSPRLKPNPERKDYAAIASDYRRWREFGRAVQLERRRLQDKQLGNDERFAILKSIRQTWKTSQNKNEMLAATTELVNFARQDFRKHPRDAGAAKRLLEARLLFARTVWTENRRDLGQKALQETKRDLAGRVSFEELYFLLGRMEEETGNLSEAEAYFSLALKERPSVGGLRDKIRWARAWVLHKSGTLPEAVVAFNELANDAKEPADRFRATYWAARDLPPGPARDAALREAKRLDPLGFYGLLASRDLNESLPPLPSVKETTSLTLTSSNEFPIGPSIVAEWLISLGIEDGTERVLLSVQNELQRNRQASNDAWLRMSTAYARAGQYLPLFALMSTLPAETRDRLLKDHPEFLFPKPWVPQVEKAARDAGVPAELVYAIIRQESAFNPRARSHAEAYGLTQLLPNIASVHARRHGIPYNGADDLFEPETSIRLGAWELRGLFDRWKGVWIPSIASYNANADAVRGWLKRRRRADPVEFIEEIPYEETRAYVKLVMRNQVFYQRMLASGPTVFPENCLKLGEPVSP